MLTCEFCLKEYSTKSNLKYHIKTNKKCIVLRGETLESKEVFNCEYCDFTTLTKSALKSHSCKNKTEFEVKQENSDLKAENKKMEEAIKLLEKQIKKSEIENKKLSFLQVELKTQKEYTSKLEEKIEKHESNLLSLASKTTNTSNVRINNIYNNLEPLDLSDERIRNEVEDNFTDNHFNDGIKGLARFTKDYILKSTEEGKTKYICSDTSRGIFKYIDENGLLQKDVKASRLKNSIQAPIKKKSHIMYMNRLDEEEHNDKAAEQVCLNFSKIRNIDVNDYAKELAFVV
jgi:hypothetical protein